jgi:hypothetical protein
MFEGNILKEGVPEDLANVPAAHLQQLWLLAFSANFHLLDICREYMAKKRPIQGPN